MGTGKAVHSPHNPVFIYKPQRAKQPDDCDDRRDEEFGFKLKKVVEATCEFVSCASIKKTHGTASRRLAMCMLGTFSYQQAFFSLAAAPTKCLTIAATSNSPGSYPKSSNDKLVFGGDKMDLKAGKI